MPDQPQECFRLKKGSNERIHTPRYIKVWELPANHILELDRPALLPSTMVADSTFDEKMESARRIAELGDKDLAARMTTFCGLRYGREEAARIL